jgi:hypothetical protein
MNTNEIMEAKELAGIIASAPMPELASYHRQIIEKYRDSALHASSNGAGMQALMTFNGYYTLKTAPGAFFAVDTNVVFTIGSEPVYDLALLISLDGTTSFRIPFTGTFDGAQLKQTDGSIGLDISLSFTRTNCNSDGTTAKCAGTIKMHGSAPTVTVSGSTYNNPIPANLFTGSYYYNDKTAGKWVEVANINDFRVAYDDGTNSGNLQPVSTYAYNLNMYYFSFPQGADTVSLVMGTAGAKGFACNNMVVEASGAITSRSLQTITDANAHMASYEWYDISGTQLAGFSGYYQIPQPGAPLAFVSIQAQYATISESRDWDLYLVMISISMDGVTSTGYYFDPATMTFENNTLTMPGQSPGQLITLTFNRTYNASNGSLVTLTGVINGTSVSGCTLFNPVPLSVLVGLP